MEEEIRQCDVLCVGGGIAGLMAAINACENGAKVIVAEKSDTRSSGSGGAGNDHFMCYIPEVHGDFEDFWRGRSAGPMGGNPEDTRHYLQNTYKMVKLWDEWGISMKYKGKYEFAGHGYPGGRPLTHLKYSGQNQKLVLTDQALKRGAEIVNRVMVFDLLKDKSGRVIGAIGVSTREEKVIIFEARSVILATGAVSNMYPAVTVGADNNRGLPITISCDGRMIAYRAGAELKGPEIVGNHAGPKYFVRFGQATWVGVLRDDSGKPIGPFVTKPDRRYGDMTLEVNRALFREYTNSGKGPIYMDMNGISKEDLDYMIYFLKQEGNEGLLSHITDEGIDLGKTAVEFQTFELEPLGGIKANYKGETSLNGLYASGDEVSIGISHAAALGWSAGENAAEYVKNITSSDSEEARTFIEEKKAELAEIMDHKDGASWQEAAYALQQIMLDYCGYVRSESMLTAGLNVLRRLKARARQTLMAENMHDLMHCLQTLNRIEYGELTIICANDRKETRGWHNRVDYMLTNPLLTDKIHIIKQVNGQPVTGWVDVRG